MGEQRSQGFPLSKLGTWFAVLAFFFLPQSLRGAVQDGYVVKVDSSVVYLDWGKASGVHPGDQFDVYRPGEALKHPVTGEILGHEEIAVAQGAVENVEEKFCTGRVLEAKQTIKAGDRTRLNLTPAEPPAKAGSASVVSAAPSTVPVELWRSEGLPHDAIGMALGDIDGDGKKDVVVAYADQIEVFRWDGQKLVSMGAFKSRSYSHYLSVETGDLQGDGHDRIFATLYYDGVKRARTIVLEFSKGALKETAHFGGFVRNLTHADGRRELVWQDMSMSREIQVRAPAPLLLSGSNYREGKPFKLARQLNSDQLFGFTWGDWDGDGSEDFAFLQYGEKLRIIFKDAHWSGKEVYGGTQADFNWENDQVATLYPRLIDYKSGEKNLLLVPHNIPATPLRFARLKIYHNSEIIALGWNGLDMAPSWTLPLAGATADFAVGDVLQKGSSQLWVAAVGVGDKTILLSYQLP